MDGHRVDTGASRDRDGRRGHDAADIEDGVPGAQVLAAATDRVAGPHRHVDRTRGGQRTRRIAAARTGRDAARVERRGLLDRDDGVGTVRQRGTGRDPERGPLLHRLRGEAAGRHLADHPQPDRRILGRGRDIGRPNRVSVHRAVVPWRQVGHGDDGHRDHLAASSVRGMRLGGQRGVKRGQDPVPRRLDRQQRLGHATPDG